MITNHWVIESHQPFRLSQADGTLNEFYSESGSVTDGSITGTSWQVANPNLGFPHNLRQADVTFTGDTATGTMTYVYRLVLNGPGNVETWRSVATITFTAQRVR